MGLDMSVPGHGSGLAGIAHALPIRVLGRTVTAGAVAA
jgi:hypothetical protein